MTEKSIDRRRFLQMGAAGLAAIPVVGMGMAGVASAQGRVDPNTPVDPESPSAQSFRFMLRSIYEDRNCGGCVFYTDESLPQSGPCAIFVNLNQMEPVGAIVPIGGWCTAFIDRARLPDYGRT